MTLIILLTSLAWSQPKSALPFPPCPLQSYNAPFSSELHYAIVIPQHPQRIWRYTLLYAMTSPVALLLPLFTHSSKVSHKAVCSVPYYSGILSSLSMNYLAIFPYLLSVNFLSALAIFSYWATGHGFRFSTSKYFSMLFLSFMYWPPDFHSLYMMLYSYFNSIAIYMVYFSLQTVQAGPYPFLLKKELAITSYSCRLSPIYLEVQITRLLYLHTTLILSILDYGCLTSFSQHCALLLTEMVLVKTNIALQSYIHFHQFPLPKLFLTPSSYLFLLRVYLLLAFSFSCPFIFSPSPIPFSLCPFIPSLAYTFLM